MSTAYFRVPAGEEQLIKDKALDWAAARFSVFLFLDSCGYEDRYGAWNWLLLAGVDRSAAGSTSGWRYGHFAYEHGAVLHPSAGLRRKSANWSGEGWQSPSVVIGRRRGGEAVEVVCNGSAQELWRKVVDTVIPAGVELPGARFRPALKKESYLDAVEALREHIAAGDCYEINLCNERTADGPVVLNPVVAFKHLRAASPAPFAALYALKGRYGIGASPERYLQKRGAVVRSQPIKGTARRHADPVLDELAMAELRASEKERAENVMIVDLVRSDLARVCRTGSVEVEELFGVQSFSTVHQMVSTVSGVLREGFGWRDAVAASFPMGSMTGAPKEMVMRLIEQYEPVPRGLFSGTIGYESPDGDADSCVVIRTLFYDLDSRRLWYSTGGAITWGSSAEAEWNETLLKGVAMERLFK